MSPNADIIDRLEPLTKQGEDYIWRPATEAVAVIREQREAIRELQHDLCAYAGVPMPSERARFDAVRAKALEDAAQMAEGAMPAAERVRDAMAPKAPIAGLEDALHSIVVTTARAIARNIRDLKPEGADEIGEQVRRPSAAEPHKSAAPQPSKDTQ